MKTLLDYCEFIVDCEHKTAPLSQEGYPSVRTPNVGRGRLILDSVNRVDEETYRAWTRRATPQAGDLIIAREAPVGNVAIVPQGVKICLGQRTVLVRPNKRLVDPAFLCYLLLGDYAQGKFHGTAAGATVPHLNMRDIRGLPLPPMPSLAQQRRIASILSAYDDLVENNTRRMAILEEIARRTYEEWFVHFRFPGHEQVRMVEEERGVIPEGWRWKSLRDLAYDVRVGVSPEQIDPSTPYVGLEHIPRRSIALQDWGSVGEVQSTKLRFSAGDILFGKIRPYFHKVAVAPVDGVASSDAIIIRAKESVMYPIVLATVSSDAFVAEATQSSNGTKMPRANWDVLLGYKIPCPPDHLVARFNEFMNPMISFLRTTVLKNRNLSATRDLLLPKLISGGIKVAGLQELEEAVPA